MLQTVYAILAMMSFMLFAVNNHKFILRNQMGMVRSEIELIGTGVVLKQLEEISAVPFDDLDLLDGHIDTSFVTMANDSLPYIIKTVVVYVEKSGDEFVVSGTTTPFKEVTLNTSGMLDSQITMSRIYSDL